MKWIGEHIWDLRSRFRNTLSIGKDSSILTNVDQSTNDISTWQLQPTNFYVNPQESTPEAIFFKPDGTKMYILGRSGDDVGEYALSTAWDISTSTYTDALTGLGSSPASEPNPYGMYISPDGIYLYIVGHSTDQVVQYTMSTAWDVSTASYTREQALTDSGGSYANPNGIHFKYDGTMFWVCSSSEDTIQQYTLSTPWDVSTLSTGHSFSLIDFFVLNDFGSSGTNADIGSSEDLFFSEDGTKVWFVENGYDSVHQLKLSTAWDIRTAVYDGKGIRHSQFESVVEGLYVNEAAGKAFTVSSSSDIVRSFNFGGAVFSSVNNASVGFDSGIGVKGNASFSGTTSFVDITAQAGYFYGSLATYSTTSLTHGNGGTVNILDGTVYTGGSTLDVMTNVFYGANAADLSVQDTYIHNMNLGKPRGGAKVTLNIGRRVGNNGSIVNHTGIMDVVSMAQTFDHYGSLDVGRTLQVDGKADLELFDLGGTVVFNDTFTETNTTAIESHTPDLGAGWTKVFDTGSTTTFNIIGGGGYGQLSNSESSDGVMFLADTTPTGVDYEVRVDFKRRDSGDDVFLIIIKYQDANNYYALQWSASYSSYCKLFRVEGGSVVNVESNFSYGAMNSTADNLSTALKLRFIDNTLMVWDIDSNDYKSFRGSYPVTTDFNDGNGGTYHKVGMAFGDLFGGGLDSTATWKIDKFEVKMLSSAATLAAATKSYIDAGNFGVGITNPTSKFHVVGDARIQGNLTVNGTYTQIDTDVTTTEQWLVTNDGTGPAAIINQKGSQDIFDVQDDGTSVFYIEDGGNVGIGTTSPGYKLDVAGTAQIQAATSAYLTFEQSSNQYQAAINSSNHLVLQSAFNNQVIFKDGGATNMVIDGTTSNVGIGTTSPAYKLDVNGGGVRLSSSNFHVYYGSYTGSWARGYLIQNSDASDQYGITGEFNNDSFEGLRIGKYVYDNKGIFIEKDGNVGIGTTSPSDKLQVSGNIKIDDNNELRVGTGNDLRFTHTGTGSYIDNYTGNLSIRNFADDSDILFQSDDGSGGVQTYFYLDGSQEFIVVNDNIQFCVGSSQDVRLYHDGSNASFKNYTGNFSIEALTNSGDMILTQFGDDRDIIFKCDDGSGGVTPYLTIDGSETKTIVSQTMEFQDNVKLAVGNSEDLTIDHNSTNSRIMNYTGDLRIVNASNDKDITFECDDGSGGVETYFYLDGSEGVVNFPDNKRLTFGTGRDLFLYHDGTNTTFKNYVGDIVIQNEADDKDIRFKSDDGSGGIAEYFRVDGSSQVTIFSKATSHGDNVKALFGDSSDLQIYHDGSDSIIKDSGTGSLDIYSSHVHLKSSGGTNHLAQFFAGGHSYIYANNVIRIEATTSGAEITGDLSVSGSVQKQISTTHHTFTFGAAGSASQDYWIPFIGNSELAAPNVTHRTIAPYTGILKKAIVHSTVAYGSSAQVRFHRIDNGTSSVFVNDNSTDDVTTNVTADMSTAYSSVAFDFTTGNTFSAGDQIGVSFVRNNTGLGDVAITLVWEYELF